MRTKACLFLSCDQVGVIVFVEWPAASVRVLVSLLRVVRQERLIPNLECVVDKEDGDGPVNVPLSLLTSAVSCGSDTLHLSVLELACVHPK